MSDRVTLTITVPFAAADPRQEHLNEAERLFKQEVGQPVEDVTVAVTSIRVGKWFKASVSGKYVNKQESLLSVESVREPRRSTKPVNTDG